MLNTTEPDSPIGPYLDHQHNAHLPEGGLQMGEETASFSVRMVHRQALARQMPHWEADPRKLVGFSVSHTCYAARLSEQGYASVTIFSSLHVGGTSSPHGNMRDGRTRVKQGLPPRRYFFLS